MKWKSPALVPAFICLGVVIIVSFLELLGQNENFTAFRKLEWMTYDWRVQVAAKRPSIVATNLGFVAIEDSSVEAVLEGSGLSYQFGLLWPRQVYGRLVRELSAQGAKVIGFDVLLGELRPDHPKVELANDKTIDSDEFFAREMRRAGNVVLAANEVIVPPEPFRTNAIAIGNIVSDAADADGDGILRRGRAFLDVAIWHPLLKQASHGFGWYLDTARIERQRLIFRTVDGGTTNLALDANGNFDAATLDSWLKEQPSNGSPRFENPLTIERFWHLGIVLAAKELELDLSQSVVDLDHGQIVFSSSKGVRRALPVDRRGRFYIDWSMGTAHPALARDKIEFILQENEARQRGAEITNRWTGKVIVVGSMATGNNITDLGATPIGQRTFLVSSYWNVANSMIMNRFVLPLGLTWSLPLIVILGMVAGFFTWNLRPLAAVGAMGAFALLYVIVACLLYLQWRIWVPIIMPIGGSLTVTHICLVTYLVRLEQRERRRTKEVFSRIVAPDIVRELLDSETFSFGGRRGEITVFFADVRGFTEMTDAAQQRSDTEVARKGLDPHAAAKYFDAQADEVLRTINLYLGTIAGQVKKHGGTLDKYIGDCVMAFWGAPVPNPRHAVCCVRAVIEAQRGIFELNRKRIEENKRREEHNAQRALKGEPTLPPLSVLSLGSGINTGIMAYGLMGSEEHGTNYTVFGREVNLASRLESASGRGRIFIGENTYKEILRDDPALASTCIPQPAITLKGFREPIKAYEVPWRSQEVPVGEGKENNTIPAPVKDRDVHS